MEHIFIPRAERDIKVSVRPFLEFGEKHTQANPGKTHQRSANIFYKGPDSKSFRICGPYGLCHSYSTLSLQRESRHRQYVNEEVWLCLSETLFMKTSSWISSMGSSMLTSLLISSRRKIS